jgi:alkylhydroperoxidase family enzyme
VQHEAIATGVGVRPEQVAAVVAGRISGKQFDQREALVLRFVEEVVNNRGATLVAEIEEALSAREVVELLLVIAHYLGLALLLNATELEPDPPADMAVVEAAQASGRIRG